MEDNSNVFDFYNGGAEIGRLERGLGVVEFYRTKEIITQYIGESKLKNGNGVDFIDDEVYMEMLRREMDNGEHIRPETYPRIIADAYFHTPEELAQEVADGGFEIDGKHAVEGCLWITPELNSKWEDPFRRERLLEIIHASERDESMMGISPHFIVAAKKA